MLRRVAARGRYRRLRGRPWGQQRSRPADTGVGGGPEGQGVEGSEAKRAQAQGDPSRPYDPNSDGLKWCKPGQTPTGGQWQ